MTDHPEFPDQTSESYLAPRYRLVKLAKENERLRAKHNELVSQLTALRLAAARVLDQHSATNSVTLGELYEALNEVAT